MIRFGENSWGLDRSEAMEISEDLIEECKHRFDVGWEGNVIEFSHRSFFDTRTNLWSDFLHFITTGPLRGSPIYAFVFCDFEGYEKGKRCPKRWKPRPANRTPAKELIETSPFAERIEWELATIETYFVKLRTIEHGLPYFMSLFTHPPKGSIEETIPPSCYQFSVSLTLRNLAVIVHAYRAPIAGEHAVEEPKRMKSG